MKEITIETLKKAADRICLDMTDEQYVTLLEVMVLHMPMVTSIWVMH